MRLQLVVISAVSLWAGSVLFVVGQEPPKEDVTILKLTEVEQLQLNNLQWKHRAVEAEYAAAKAQLLNEVRDYVGAVTAAHPEAKATFDSRSLGWVQHVGKEGGRK